MLLLPVVLGVLSVNVACVSGSVLKDQAGDSKNPLLTTAITIPAWSEGTTDKEWTYETTWIPGPCPHLYDQIEEGCYLFNMEELMTWEEARDFCKSKGGDLALIKTCSLLGSIVRHIHVSGKEADGFSQGFWIGGTDRGEEGVWTWLDSTPMSLGIPFWGMMNGVLEPSGGDEQNCAILFKTDEYYLHDDSCSAHGNALCQYEEF